MAVKPKTRVSSTVTRLKRELEEVKFDERLASAKVGQLKELRGRDGDTIGDLRETLGRKDQLLAEATALRDKELALRIAAERERDKALEQLAKRDVEIARLEGRAEGIRASFTEAIKITLNAPV